VGKWLSPDEYSQSRISVFSSSDEHSYLPTYHMRLTAILYEELYCQLNEADIRQLNPASRGLKAYEMAYNRLLAKGVLKGDAMPLELVHDSTTPRLTRTKNTFQMHADSTRKAPYAEDDFGGDGHDLFHIITSSMAKQFASFETKAVGSNKFNGNKTLNIFALGTSAFKKQFGFDPVLLYRQTTQGGDLQNITEQDMSDLEAHIIAELKNAKFDYYTIDRILSSKDNVGSAEGVDKTLTDKIRLFLFAKGLRRYKGASKTHYEKPHKVAVDGNGNITVTYQSGLPQYDAEEDAGNILVFKNIFTNSDTLTPLVNAIRLSRPISDNELQFMLTTTVRRFGMNFTRNTNSDPLAAEKTKELKTYIMTVLPKVMEAYNYYISLLNKMPGSEPNPSVQPDKQQHDQEEIEALYRGLSR